MVIPKATQSRWRQAGLSLIELIMFIVIVSVGVAGILTVMNVVTRKSADPLIRKQALAIAESLLEEIEAQPFTYCDPDDPNNVNDPPPASSAGCSNANFNQSALPLGTQAALQGETRYSASLPFDNVSDYAGFSMTGIRLVEDGSVITDLGSYDAAVAISEAGATFGLTASNVLRIDVTVTGPSNTTIALSGYRFRYAPNATP